MPRLVKKVELPERKIRIKKRLLRHKRVQVTAIEAYKEGLVGVMNSL